MKSNAILLAKGGATVGVGMGQVNRVDSARLSVARAGERATGSAAASDAFFPFPDGLQVLIDAGVAAVVQPGGSVRDEEVIAAATAAGITMYLTGTRHFTTDAITASHRPPIGRRSRPSRPGRRSPGSSFLSCEVGRTARAASSVRSIPAPPSCSPSTWAFVCE